MSQALRRLERRVVVRARVRDGGRRVVSSLPAILQIVAAVAASYSVTHWGLGHQVPVLAVTVTIASLGLTRDARPRRVAESVTGIVLGVLVSEALSLVVGRGVWQLAVVLIVVLVVGRFLSPNPQFAVGAAIPSAIAILLPAGGGPLDRTIDAVIAGAVALLATALIPRDPGRTAAADRRTVFRVLAESAATTAEAFRDGSEAAAETALARVRRAEPLVEAWRMSLDTAIAIARLSPWLRGRLPDLRRGVVAVESADLVVRHLRLISRRAQYLVRDGVARPALADAVQTVATGIQLLGDELGDPALAGQARSLIRDLARRLDPTVLAPDANLPDAAALLLLRPLCVDLLVGTGMSRADAQAVLPAV